MVVNHPLNSWNFQLAWFVGVEVPSRLGPSVPFGIREEGNLSFLLLQTKLILV